MKVIKSKEEHLDFKKGVHEVVTHVEITFPTDGTVKRLKKVLEGLDDDAIIYLGGEEDDAICIRVTEKRPISGYVMKKYLEKKEAQDRHEQVNDRLLARLRARSKELAG
jgi:hypothetical protein